MTRALLRLTGILVLLSLLAAGGSIAFGRLLPPMPLAVFISVNEHYDMDITQVDTRTKTVHHLRVTDIEQYPYTRDIACHIVYTASVNEQLRLGYFDLQTGAHRYFLDVYKWGGYVSWLPDNRRTWIQYFTGRASPMAYILLDTASGAILPVNLSRYENLPPASVTWSPDSHYGVLAGRRDESRYVYLLDTATAALTPLKAARNQVFLWSPDSRYLAAYNISTDIALYDTVTGTWREQRFGDIQANSGISWTPDNRLLFLARVPTRQPDFQGYAWSPEDNRLTEIGLHIPAAHFNPNLPRRSAWSPDGTRLFYEDADSGVHLLDTHTGTEIAHVYAPGNFKFFTLIWSPDSRYLAAYHIDAGTLTFTDAQTGAQTVLNLMLNEDSLAAFIDAWPGEPEPGLFDARTSTLGRIVFSSGGPQFVPDIGMPDAYRAVYCPPEAIS